MRKENRLKKSAIKDILTASGGVYLKYAQSLLSKVLGTKILHFQRGILGSIRNCKTVEKKSSKTAKPQKKLIRTENCM